VTLGPNKSPFSSSQFGSFLSGLLAILAKNIAIAILGGKSIATLFAILHYSLPPNIF